MHSDHWNLRQAHAPQLVADVPGVHGDLALAGSCAPPTAIARCVDELEWSPGDSSWRCGEVALSAGDAAAVTSRECLDKGALARTRSPEQHDSHRLAVESVPLKCVFEVLPQ